jgi:hypothetical protein
MAELDNEMKASESGMNPIIYESDEPKDYRENRIKELWGTITTALLIDQSEAQKRPYLLRILDARNESLDKLKRQEFALAHNLRLKDNG